MRLRLVKVNGSRVFIHFIRNNFSNKLDSTQITVKKFMCL
jgi:hypothetical protein